MLRGGGFLPGRRGGGFLPDEERRWLLTRCGAAVAALSSVVECIGTDSEGWRVSKFRKCRERCGESRTNVDKCSEVALIVEEVLLQ